MFLTGNTRVVTVGGSFSGGARIAFSDLTHKDDSSDPAEPAQNYENVIQRSSFNGSSQAAIFSVGCSATVSTDVGTFSNPVGSLSGTIPNGLISTRQTLIASSLSFVTFTSGGSVDVIQGHDFTGGSQTLTKDASGTWTGSCTVAEAFEFVTAPAPWYLNVPDAPPVTYLKYFEILVPGSGVSCSASSGSLSISGSGTVPNALIRFTSYTSVATCEIKNHALVFTNTYESYAFAFTNTGTVTATGATVTWSDSDSVTGASVNSGSGATVSITSPTSLTANGLVTAACSVSRSPDIPFSLSAVVLTASNNAYPDPLTFSCSKYLGDPSPEVTGTGGFAVSYTQRSYAASGTADIDGLFGASFTGPSVNEYQPFSAAITSASLAANGEDPAIPGTTPTDYPRIGRLLIYGQSFAGITLSHAVTLTIAGAFPAAAATLTKTYSPEVPADSYPYLRLSVRGVGAANLPAKVTIPPCSAGVATNETDNYTGAATPSKFWEFKTGANGTYGDVDLPLFAPDNLSVNTDDRDGQYPYPVRKSSYDGVWRIGQIIVALTGTAGTNTIEVQSATLVRKSAIAATWLPTWQHSIYRDNTTPPTLTPEWPDALVLGPDRVVSASDTTSYDYARRFLYAHADGMPVLEEWDFGYTRTVGGATGVTSYSFNVRSIQGLCDAVNGSVNQYNSAGTVAGSIRLHPGWTATPGVAIPSAFVPAFTGDLPPATPYYYNAGLPAVYLAGKGQKDMDGGLSVTAWPLYDQIETYPGGPSSFTCGAVLRGVAQGQLLTPAAVDGSPGRKAAESGKTVTLTQQADFPVGGVDETGQNRGTGVSGADGWYFTGNPAGRAGNTAHRAKIGAFESGFGGDAWFSRRRHRASFIVTPEELTQWLSADVSDAFRLLRAVLKTGNLRIEAWGGGVGSSDTWPGITSAIPCIHPTIRFRHKDAANTLVVASETTGATPHSIQRRTTTDEGRSYSAMTTVFTEGYFPAFCTAPTGLEYHYSLTTNADSTAAIQGKILGGQGQTVVATFTAVASSAGIKADIIAAAWRNGVIILLYRKASDNSIVTLRSADGVTFA